MYEKPVAFVRLARQTTIAELRTHCEALLAPYEVPIELHVHEMSEMGNAAYNQQLTSYQIDRSKFDRDLAEMNRRIGIEVDLGTRVLDDGPDAGIHLDPEKGHVVETSSGRIRCKYLIDA